MKRIVQMKIHQLIQLPAVRKHGTSVSISLFLCLSVCLCKCVGGGVTYFCVQIKKFHLN